jgi:hypothetical protein
MNMKFFVGACILIGGLLLKLGAPLPSVAAGLVLAAMWNWKGMRLARVFTRSRP